jgi:hypothetical protein
MISKISNPDPECVPSTSVCGVPSCADQDIDLSTDWWTLCPTRRTKSFIFWDSFSIARSWRGILRSPIRPSSYPSPSKQRQPIGPKLGSKRKMRLSER